MIHLTPNMSRGQIHLVLGKYNVGEDDFAHVVAHLDSLEALIEERVRAEVMAACSANVEETCVILLKIDRPKNEKVLIAGACTLVQSRLEVLSPAASDLEALLREAELRSLQAIMKKASSLSRPCNSVGHYVIERIAELQR